MTDDATVDPANEESRLASLRRHRILDSAGESMFDDITELAAFITGTTVSMINLIDRDRLWVKSSYPPADGPNREYPRESSFCDHTIRGTGIFEVADLARDPRFVHNPYVTGEHAFRFYAGVPLVNRDGFAIGSLCVLDQAPRVLDEKQRAALAALSRQTMTLVELRRAYGALEEQRESFDRMFETLTESVFVLDAGDVVLDLNGAGARLVGVGKNAMVGRPLHHWFDRLVNEEGGELDPQALFAAAEGTGSPQRGIAGIDRKFGGFCWVEYALVKQQGGAAEAGAAARRFLLTFRDITAYRIAGLEMRRLAGLKEIIFEQAHLAVIAGDVSGTIYLFNRTAELLTGFEANDVVGRKSFSLFLDPATPPGKAGEDSFIRHRSGRRIPVSISESHLTDERGGAVGQVWLVRDLTESRKLEQSIERQRVALVNGAKMASLGEMAGGVAHEINNPVTIICASAEDLKLRAERGSLTPADLGAGLNKINETAIRISKIVKGLQTISRDATHDPLAAVRVKQIVDDTLQFCLKRFQASRVQLNVIVGETVAIRGRASQISQVLLNLLGNAFDATEGQPLRWVTLAVKTIGSRVQIEVVDGGPPIPDSVRERMMNPFFTTKPIGKGTGLGLSISRQIVEAHGGQLYLRSGAANTTFVVELPGAPEVKASSAG